MNNIAPLTKRFSAYLLDILFVYLLIGLINQIRVINPNYDKYVEESKKYVELVNNYSIKEDNKNELLEQYEDVRYNLLKYSVSNSIISIVVLFGYYCLFQKFNNGQTLGKKIMKIKVVDNNGNNLSLFNYFLRVLLIDFATIGNFTSITINTILILLISKKTFLLLDTSISYVVLGVTLITIILMFNRKDKKGLHDILALSNVVME